MHIALYEPDIPQNTGTILRLCACFGIEAHIIEPAGFPTTDRAFRRAGMDYLDAVAIVRHRTWQDFEAWRSGKGHRLLLFTTVAPLSYLEYRYAADDILLFGREFRWRATGGFAGRRCAAENSDAARSALAQCRGGRGHGGGRGAAADRRNPRLALTGQRGGPDCGRSKVPMVRNDNLDNDARPAHWCVKAS